MRRLDDIVIDLVAGIDGEDRQECELGAAVALAKWVHGVDARKQVLSIATLFGPFGHYVALRAFHVLMEA